MHCDVRIGSDSSNSNIVKAGMRSSFVAVAKMSRAFNKIVTNVLSIAFKLATQLQFEPNFA